MKKMCLFVAICILATLGVYDKSVAQDDTFSKYNASQPALSTTPQGFNEIGNPKTSPAISTGYYLVDDSNPDAWARWKPAEKELASTSVDSYLWRRIYSGPRQVPVAMREGGGDEGIRYFRNPADRAHMFNQHDKVTPVDSVNAAFAGPIPLGFAFYFNGIRYDSFYVSAKGVISLTNRRYFYDNNGKRVKPAGMQSCYDPMSADWFARGRERQGDGLSDATPDNYGYLFVTCGGDEDNRYGGIRRGQAVADNQAFTNAGHFSSMAQLLNIAPGAAYISPFYGPYYLPQYDPIRKVTDDFGQVWYKRSLSSDKLIIYYKNLTMLPGQYNLPNNNNSFTIGTNAEPLGRPIQDIRQLSASCQVILNRVDSSITYLYGDFKGTVVYGNIGGQSSPEVFMSPFMVIGVGGYARHVGYDSKNPGSEAEIWAAEYPQYTEQQPGNQNPNGNQNKFANFFNANYKVKFKQWRNALRLVDVQYLTRSKEITAGLGYTEVIKSEDVQDAYDPFELFAGEERLGSMQPVAIIQNLTNEIQGPRGVNFVKQDFQFQARFRVRNVAFDRFVYNRVARISNHCLRLEDGLIDKINCTDDEFSNVRYVNVTKAGANYNATVINMADNQNGIPPYEFVRVRFSKFEPNQYIDNQIGLMEAQAITEAIDPVTNEVIGDHWPFDDSSRVKFWVVRRLKEFRDEVADNGFHSIENTLRPSVLKWVHNDNNGPRVAGASPTQTSAHPMPPIGIARTANPPNTALLSPFIEMNWNADPNMQRPVGDKLTSFPIDLRNKNGAFVALSVQRNSSAVSTARGFCDNQLIGPEHRAVFSGNDGAVNQYVRGDAANFDYLAIEFLKPSPDGIKHITNTGTFHVKDSSSHNQNSTKRNPIWRYHPEWKNGEIVGTPIETTPALAIYGGGGYFIGWDYADKKVYKPVAWGTTSTYNRKVTGGVMYNPYDIGYDYEFYKYMVPIPDYYIDGAFDGGKNFRFRVRVIETDGAYGDQKSPMQYMNTVDEGGADLFYIDNIAVVFNTIVPDIEMEAVKVIWPYTSVPASQANDIDVVTRFTNVSNCDARPFTIKVKIFKGFGATGQPVYCRTIQQASLRAGASTELNFPQFAARRFGQGVYTLQAISIYPGGDAVRSNDTTTSEFRLVFSECFTYDDGASNDVATEVGITGKGLNLFGATFGGYNVDLRPMGVQTMGTGLATDNPYKDYYVLGRPYIDYITGGSFSMINKFPWYPGPVDGFGSGQIAVKFKLSASDTIRGFQAYFTEINQAFDDISFAVYRNSNDDLPANQVGKTLYARRLLSKKMTGAESAEPKVGEFVLYELPVGIALEKGTYWAAIAQRGKTGLELGASGQRMAMRTMFVSAEQDGTLGNRGIQLLVDKSLRVPKVDKNYGTVYVNDNIFAFENVLNTGDWYKFMPTIGQVAYAHFDHYGRNGDNYRTLSRATWMPLLRPYFGDKVIEEDTTRYPCPDDIVGGGSNSDSTKKNTPVEIVSFNGNSRNNAIEIMWETASEINNYGFLLERANIEDGEWKEITFEKGAGNSTTARRYRYNDTDVESGKTYQYRLLQMDYDGTLSCHNNNIITVSHVAAQNQEIVLEQNAPNPFNDVTYINFFMPRNDNVTLEVVDVFGKVVRTILSDETVNAGDASYAWNGRDNLGNKVTTGSYMIRLTVGDNILTKKMSLIRSN